MAVITDVGLGVPRIPAARIGRGYWAGVGRRLLRDPVAVAAAAVILAIVLAAIFAPWVAPADPYRASMLRRLRPVGDAIYPLGSDELGRDMLSRLIYGGRLSLNHGHKNGRLTRVVPIHLPDRPEPRDRWLTRNGGGCVAKSGASGAACAAASTLIHLGGAPSPTPTIA
jgi:hypothetical protein